MLPGGSLRFVSLTDVFSTHYTACKDHRSQVRLFHAPARMKTSTVEGGLWSLQIIRAQESTGALADIDAPAFRPVADLTLQSLLQGEPSMLVQVGKKTKRGDGAKTPSAARGHDPVDVDRSIDDDDDDEDDVDPMIDGIDEYDLMCNEDEDAVAQSDAALADCSKDEQKNVDRAHFASVEEKNCRPLAQHKGSDKIVDQVVSHLRKAHGDSIALTQEELEEEAVLLLIRQVNQGASYDDVVDDVGRKLVAEVAEQSQTEDDPQNNSQARASSQTGDLSNKQKSAGSTVARAEEQITITPFLFEDSDVGTSAASASSVASGELDSTDEGMDDGNAQDRLPKFVAKWHAEFRRTAEALLFRADRNELPLGHDDEVSLLVSLRSMNNCDMFQLFFVKWVDAANRTGRSVRIDKSFRVVYSPPVLFGKPVPSQSFPSDGFACLINACAASSRKQKGTSGMLRQQLPPEIIRFARLMGLHCAWTKREPWLELVACRHKQQSLFVAVHRM